MTALKIAIRTGATPTTGKVACFSLTTTNPTVTVNGVDYTVGSGLTRNEIGTDGVGGSQDSSVTAPVALFGWVTDTITGLSPKSDYAITVTQGAETETGTLRTMPAATATRVRGAFITCDARGDQSGEDVGFWGYLQNNIADIDFIVHTDDHGYADQNYISVESSGRKVFLPAASPDGVDTETINAGGSGYAYACGYASYLGLIDSKTTFHDPARIYCHHHRPMICGIGDHEMMDNPGETANITVNHKTQALDVYMKTIGACELGYVNESKNSASVNKVGPLEFIIYDRVLGCSAGLQNFNPTTQTSANIATGTSSSATTRILGPVADQETPLINAVDTESPFKILCMSSDPYAMMSQSDRAAAISDDWLSNQLGGSQPLHEYTECADGTSEWTELSLKKGGVGSIVGKAISYSGTVLALHGDIHRPCAYYYYRPETSTHYQLNLWSISCGSVNGRGLSRLHSSYADYAYYKGSTQMWIHPDTPRTAGGSFDAKSSGIIFEANKVNGEWNLEVDIREVVTEGASETNVLYSKTFKGNKTTYAPDFLRTWFVGNISE